MGYIISLIIFNQELVILSYVATCFESWMKLLEIQFALPKNFDKTLGSQIGYGGEI